ncbi:MAG: BMP family ABC transporter substrate-binding protein [Lachnospiraceae bacterium]|nr:BMP family ABC transporter substrate-binding protein [Lachnospiraceae bacterium]MDY5701494.1 BMP family ABC transporter substrate-binding protein [Lachnospiraceae bacterium]
MKKRIVSLLLAAAMTLSLAGCVSKDAATQPQPEAGETQAAQETGTEAGSGYELALITDVGTIDDKSFNQGSWEGLKAYADENGISCKYYKPEEKSDEACLAAIDLAVKGGAKLIVTPGFLFEVPIYEAQSKYPDVKFVIIDAKPAKDGTVEIADNVVSIFYAEEQAGYLAGYAVVKDGYRNLGFMGGIAVPPVVRYGYGFIQGAEAAAQELGLAAGEVKVKYTYVGNFDASPENQTLAKSWYTEGVECIFACGGQVGNSVMAAAEGEGKAVIGVDVDQSGESETVITSSMKNLSNSVYEAVASFYDGTFAGGTSTTLTAAEDGVQLPMESSKFENFTQEEYDKVFAAIKSGEISIGNDTLGAEPTDVPTTIVEVGNVK